MATRSRRGSSVAMPEPLTYEARLRRRMLARRRLRRRRIATGAVLVATVLAAAMLVVARSGGSSATVGAKAARATTRAGALQKPKPAPPPQLPRGGRTLLPGHLIVAYYGIVGTSNILGKSGDLEADAAGVERQARAYRRFGRPVQPAFELVTTFAAPSPGTDGTYSAATDRSIVQRYLEAAHRHKLLLILDFQPGRGEFLPEVRRYERFLLDPAVGVALDPEWKLGLTELPDRVIGSSSAASINVVSAYLSRLVRTHRLPQKLFIVHEFQLRELPDRQGILFRPGLATVLQMDGLGPVSTKLESYRKVTRGAFGFHPGFKVFLRPV